MVQTPMGEQANIAIESDGETLSIVFCDGNSDPVDIAWEAPATNGFSQQDIKARFKWLASSAAAFHKIPVQDNSGTP